jgi:hypothetical protein
MQACYYSEEEEMPLFVMFFEDQAEVKRFQARQFLKYLRKRQGKICLPDLKVRVILLFKTPWSYFKSRKDLVPTLLVSLPTYLHGLLKLILKASMCQHLFG